MQLFGKCRVLQNCLLLFCFDVLEAPSKARETPGSVRAFWLLHCHFSTDGVSYCEAMLACHLWITRMWSIMSLKPTQENMKHNFCPDISGTVIVLKNSVKICNNTLPLPNTSHSQASILGTFRSRIGSGGLPMSQEWERPEEWIPCLELLRHICSWRGWPGQAWASWRVVLALWQMLVQDSGIAIPENYTIWVVFRGLDVLSSSLKPETEVEAGLCSLW